MYALRTSRPEAASSEVAEDPATPITTGTAVPRNESTNAVLPDFMSPSDSSAGVSSAARAFGTHAASDSTIHAATTKRKVLTGCLLPGTRRGGFPGAPFSKASSMPIRVCALPCPPDTVVGPDAMNPGANITDPGYPELHGGGAFLSFAFGLGVDL